MTKQLFCDFEGHEILKIEDEYIYLYKAGEHYKKNGLAEMTLLESLSDRLPLLDTQVKVVVDDRIGFKIQADSMKLMAFEIRNDQEHIKKYANRLADLLIKLHQVDLSLIQKESLAIRSLNRFNEYIKKMEYLTEYKDRLLEIYATIADGSSLCHLDLGPYHVLEVNEEDCLIGLHSLSLGNPMSDIAKTIFWLCSGYVPGIGTYLMTEGAKRDFVQFLIDRYQSKLRYCQEEVNQWLVILAALEFNNEFPEEGMREDLKAMKNIVEDYFAGNEIDYLGQLIWFEDVSSF